MIGFCKQLCRYNEPTYGRQKFALNPLDGGFIMVDGFELFYLRKFMTLIPFKRTKIGWKIFKVALRWRQYAFFKNESTYFLQTLIETNFVEDQKIKKMSQTINEITIY